MRVVKMMFLVALVLLAVSSPVLAQAPGTGMGSGEIRFLGAAVGMAIASGLCGLGQGKAVSSAAEALARNPGARAGIQTLLVLGLAFIESLAIFTLLIVFVNIGVK
jgi:F-type H+-transporting ATPase subunit c